MSRSLSLEYRATNCRDLIQEVLYPLTLYTIPGIYFNQLPEGRPEGATLLPPIQNKHQGLSSSYSLYLALIALPGCCEFLKYYLNMVPMNGMFSL